MKIGNITEFFSNRQTSTKAVARSVWSNIVIIGVLFEEFSRLKNCEKTI